MAWWEKKSEVNDHSNAWYKRSAELAQRRKEQNKKSAQKFRATIAEKYQDQVVINLELNELINAKSKVCERDQFFIEAVRLMVCEEPVPKKKQRVEREVFKLKHTQNLNRIAAALLSIGKIGMT